MSHLGSTQCFTWTILFVLQVYLILPFFPFFIALITTSIIFFYDLLFYDLFILFCEKVIN